MKNNKIVFIRSVLVILIVSWCSLVFFMSHEPANVSSNRSGVLTNVLSSIFFFVERGILEVIVRKTAHIFSYFVLSTLVSLLVNTYDFKNTLRYVISLSFTFLYAASDEIHQYFVVGRACRMSDVMIDMIGGVGGALLVGFLMFIFKTKRNSQKEK